MLVPSPPPATAPTTTGTTSAVDTAQLLATLSNIGNGSLSNLNIPGLPATTNNQQPVANENKAALPPALAQLLGGLVSNSPSESHSTPPPPPPPSKHIAHDPRMATQEAPLQKGVWPPPQGPSIPKKIERKSKWDTNQEPVYNNNGGNWQQHHQKPQRQQQGYNPSQDSYQQFNQHQQQPHYNKPQFNNQSQYNQQQYGQSQFNQPQYNQPQYNQPQYNQQQFHQQQPSYDHQQHQQPHQQLGSIQGTQPFSDSTLPSGCIRGNYSLIFFLLPFSQFYNPLVLTRTLFIGPIPDHYDKNEVAQLFSQYGDIASIIVSKKTKGRHNAFLKFKTRAATETAKYESEGLVVENVPVKVNWGFGFGPKKHFDYDRGDSIIPLTELSNDEKQNLVTAPVGGFQGQPVRDHMVIEEPEAHYRPEWKNSDNNKRSMDDHGMSNRKRTRFNDINQQQFYNNNSPFAPSIP